MNILFLTPPVSVVPSAVPALTTIAPYTHYAWFAAFLTSRLKDAAVSILDCPAEGIGWEDFDNEILQRAPHLVCVGTYLTSQVPAAMEAFRRIKHLLPNVHTLGEGTHFGTLPRESLLEFPELDYVVSGDAEPVLLQLTEMLVVGATDLHQIQGLTWRDTAHRVVVNDASPLISNLDDLPVPAFDLFPIHRGRYRRLKFIDQYFRIYTSRGCVGRCVYCAYWPQYRGAYRIKSGVRVFEEISALKTQYGVRNIEIHDPDFGHDRLMLQNLVNALIKANLGVNLWAMMRADNLAQNLDLVSSMRRAGFRLILIGVESNVDQRLEWAHKRGITTDINKVVIKELRRFEILSIASVMIGWPDDTEESISQLFKWVDTELDPDLASFTVLQPLPGTPFWRERRSTLPSDYSVYDRIHAIISTQHIDRDRLNGLLSELNLRFYTNKDRFHRISSYDNELAACLAPGLAKMFCDLASSELGEPGAQVNFDWVLTE